MHVPDTNGASKRESQFMEVMATFEQYETSHEKEAKQAAAQFYKEGQQNLTLCRLF